MLRGQPWVPRGHLFGKRQNHNSYILGMTLILFSRDPKAQVLYCSCLKPRVQAWEHGPRALSCPSVPITGPLLWDPLLQVLLSQAQKSSPMCLLPPRAKIQGLHFPAFFETPVFKDHAPPIPFFFFGWDWSLNSGLCTCKAGTLSLVPPLQFILLWLFWR
jgi:hypothetical protein